MEKIFLVLMVGLLTGCVSTTNVEGKLASHLGNNIQDAIEKMGRPTKVQNMQDGTWHYLWTQKSKVGKAATIRIVGVPLSTRSQSECTKVLVVDKQKMVVGYDTEGNC